MIEYKFFAVNQRNIALHGTSHSHHHANIWRKNYEICYSNVDILCDRLLTNTTMRNHNPDLLTLTLTFDNLN